MVDQAAHQVSHQGGAVRSMAEITGYHAHVYYDAATTKDVATRLRERVAERFAVMMGRWHDELVGPHTRSMYQIAFEPALFATLVPWLMLNHEGLTILIHPNTDSPHDDHVVHPLWLGGRLDVNPDRLPHSLAAIGEDHSPVVVNTQPTLPC
jgi:aromatic ring-cleaving dioxygenase